MKVKFITPHRVLFDGEVDMIVVPGAKGRMGILENHEPTITKLIEGSVELHQSGVATQSHHIKSGFVEVSLTECKIFGIEEVRRRL